MILLSSLTNDRHRLFFVNGSLEFALFYDYSIKDKEKIKQNFLNQEIWKSYLKSSTREVLSIQVADNLKEVHITTRPKPSKKSKKKTTENM